MEKTSDLVGIIVLVVVVAASGWLSWRTARFPRGGSLMDGMIRTTFLPEKRRTYLQILSLEGSAINLAALAWALTTLGWLAPDIGGAVVAGLLLVAVASVVALTNLGLSRRPLSEAEKATIRRDAPDFLVSLAALPIDGIGPRPPEP